MTTFLHISDTHISGGAPDDPHWQADAHGHPNAGVAALIQAVNRLPFAFDFILHTGDVCNDPDEANYQRARELLIQLPGPVYLLPGNHDSSDLMRRCLHDGSKLRLLQDDHVQLGGLHLLTLDSGDEDSHQARLCDAQIDFLEAQLRSIGAEPTIVAMHHMPVASGVEYFDDKMRPQIGDRVHDVLKRHSGKIAGVFFGHVHLTAATLRDGILYACCPSTHYNNFAYPGMPERITDPLAPGGFNLVMIGDHGVFLRRFHLPMSV